MDQRFGLNASYVEALRAQWRADPYSVADEWRRFFAEDGNGHAEPTQQARPAPTPQPSPKTPTPTPLPAGAHAEVLRGVAARIAENMTASLDMPTAMSTRVMPVKVLEENRRVVNSYLEDDARPRASFTHLIAWAIVRAAQAVPAMNHGFGADGDGRAARLVRDDVNLGLAIDLPARDGGRTLVVPNLRAVQKLDFRAFLDAYGDLVERARKQKLKPDEFDGTTISLTNPGGIGTVASAPRLMNGQGTIVATGAIGYPAEYEAMAPETLRALGIGKVMTMTSTYDHRVIQGAESGAFLQRIHELLNGEHGFYDEVFRAIRIPHHPYRLRRDRVVQGVNLGFGETERAMRVSQLIHSFRVRGHILANVDPLDLRPRDHPELNIEEYGLTIWDLDREFLTLGTLPKPIAPLRDVLERLRDTYSRRMGVEYMHINDMEQRRWMQQRVEKPASDDIGIDDKRQALRKLHEAQGFERFLHKRYLGQKRFSVEGAESVIAILSEALDQAAAFGVTDVLIGMAHRGRLNVLANVVGKPYEAIFAEFDDVDPKSWQGSGDVKYHLGARGTWRWKGPDVATGVVDERDVRIELACNPSHLEAVDPVVLGQCRAKQDLLGDRARRKVVPLLVHGDAAFAAQGVVYETMQMSALQGYRVGGCVHVVINNQIGYTTGPEKARTSPNASDIARAIMAPVLRVNGDDPEACIRAIRIAFEYRMKFARDVVVDMVCYRRWGHNEGDEPSFTQPILYRAIEQHEAAPQRYGALLVRRGDLTGDEVKAIEADVSAKLDAAFGSLREKLAQARPSAPPAAAEDVVGDDVPTGVPVDVLKRITDRITFDPEIIEIHPRVKSTILDRRRQMVFDGKPGIDFGTAELLAFGSLLLEGTPVRISGQDVGRGTFAQRHAILYDVKDGRPYIPLNYLHKTRDEGEEEWNPSRFRVYDSLLSEEAVLGFEYGYSITHPDSVVLWEAQFGDFVNGAQVQIDQFIAAGESKWNQRCGVVLLLPHGYDGQGPEHSSGRMERFLQLAAEDNLRVAVASSPAQYFHLLRRQARLPKKPLVVFTHKSLLRAEDASSTVEELATGSFRTVVDDPRHAPDARARRLVLCTGKLYWELDRTRLKEPAPDVAVVRLEQIHPFPAERLRAVLAARRPAEVVWAQEEPRNMGAADFVLPRLRALGVEPLVACRPAAASPATGSHKRHVAEQAALIAAALGRRPDPAVAEASANDAPAPQPD